MNAAELQAMKALMRGLAILLRLASWQLLGKFDKSSGAKERYRWGRFVKLEANDLFKEASKIEAGAAEAWNTSADRTCEFELNTSMNAIRCNRCSYELPAGTTLSATRFCGGCGAEVQHD